MRELFEDQRGRLSLAKVMFACGFGIAAFVVLLLSIRQLIDLETAKEFVFAILAATGAVSIGEHIGQGGPKL